MPLNKSDFISDEAKVVLDTAPASVPEAYPYPLKSIAFTAPLKNPAERLTNIVGASVLNTPASEL